MLFLFKVTIGIRTDEETENAGLDISEHGMWGYPEFFIPVPGGYGTDTHRHVDPAQHLVRSVALQPRAAESWKDRYPVAELAEVAEGLAAPALIVVGEVVALRESLCPTEALLSTSKSIG